MKPYFAFQWHITDMRDQRCRHCYIFAEVPEIIDAAVAAGASGDFYAADPQCWKETAESAPA